MNIDLLIQIFVEVDDFFIQYEQDMRKIRLDNAKKGTRNRTSRLCESEMMTIMIAFHHSHYTNFKAYYLNYVSEFWRDLFPNLVSYERFNQTQSRIMLPMIMFLNHHGLGASRGINFIDSTPLRVCHIKRERQHRTFKEIASKGKSTMGWFYGFKLHLIINDKGEILSFYLSEANVDDRNLKVLSTLTRNIFGKLFGDRGYISQKLADFLWNDGISLVYKRRRNMKKQNLSDEDKLFLRKRALIESVNDELKNICNIEHTRHRSLKGFLNNMVSALCAYHFLPKKPSLKFDQYEKRGEAQLLIAA